MFQLYIICEKGIIYHMFFTNVLRENQHFRYCRDKVVKWTFLAGFIIVIPIYNKSLYLFKHGKNGRQLYS